MEQRNPDEEIVCANVTVLNGNKKVEIKKVILLRGQKEYCKKEKLLEVGIKSDCAKIVSIDVISTHGYPNKKSDSMPQIGFEKSDEIRDKKTGAYQ